MKEYRVWGPPGTGKTTWIARMAAVYADKFGSDQVSICSLTNAAVREATNRDIPLDSDNMTTLHARCKRSLNAPPPAESHMRDFAEANPRFSTDKQLPLRRMHLGENRGEDILASGFTTYDQVQIARQQMVPPEEWTLGMRKWYKAWSEWCIESGLMDYSSWLEVAKETGSLPSQNVVLIDEAQDHTPLQLATIRSWDTRNLILVGDDDQSLYEWSGAIPDKFLSPSIHMESEKTLEQSYRIPQAVHSLAMDILSKISNRKMKRYQPTSAVGFVSHSNFSLDTSKETFIPGIDDGQSHMILASCSYMLNGIIKYFKDIGIQYHNPYRKLNPEWNPLYTEIATSARGYLMDVWTGTAIIDWMKIISPDVFKDKDGLLSLCNDNLDREILYNEIYPFLSEATAETLLSRKPEALLNLKGKSVVGLWRYYGKVFKMNTIVSPKIIIGTIHSVKGGEADVVHVFPDLSSAGYMDMRYNPDRIHRLFYVAVTRARQSVVIHEAGDSRYAYPIGRRKRYGHRN